MHWKTFHAAFWDCTLQICGWIPQHFKQSASRSVYLSIVYLGVKLTGRYNLLLYSRPQVQICNIKFLSLGTVGSFVTWTSNKTLSSWLWRLKAWEHPVLHHICGSEWKYHAKEANLNKKFLLHGLMPGFFQRFDFSSQMKNLSFFRRGTVQHWPCTTLLCLEWGGLSVGGAWGE